MDVRRAAFETFPELKDQTCILLKKIFDVNEASSKDIKNVTLKSIMARKRLL